MNVRIIGVNIAFVVQGKEDKNVLEDRKPELRKLQIESAVKMGDNFELNRALRAGLRYAKKLDEGPLDDERTFAKGNNAKLNIKITHVASESLKIFYWANYSAW